jgi:hypothetical protein
MKIRILMCCLAALLLCLMYGCDVGTAEKYKIYVDAGGNQNHIVYCNDFHIDEYGFLTVLNPMVSGEPDTKRVICSPGTYVIFDKSK